ncbi:MAG: hypothetical protein AAGJ82_08075, partial [Bacteroidota bacterium]
MPTSDGGYLLVGSADFGNIGDFDGRVVKIDASGNQQWCIGTNIIGQDYFYDAVELANEYYVVGATVEEGTGDLQPFIRVYTSSGVERAVDSELIPPDAGKFLTIELTYGGNILVGGFYNDGSPEGGNTNGFYQVFDPSLTSLFGPVSVGNQVAKITQSTDGNYYIFGTTYNAADQCSTPVSAPGESSNSVAAQTFAGDVLVRKADPFLNLLFPDLQIGGDSPDSFVDGIATAGGGFAIIGNVSCVAPGVGELTGPNNIAFQNNNFDPYWLYSGDAQGNLNWLRGDISLTGAIDIASIPFGLELSCEDQTFIVANNETGFIGQTSVDLFEVSATQRTFLSSGSIPGVYTEGRDLAIGNNGENVISGIGGLDGAFLRFGPAENCAVCDQCAEADAYLPTAYQCETFETYNEGDVTPQSTVWSQWPSSTGDAQVTSLNEVNKVLQISSSTINNDVLFRLNGNGPDGDINSGRHRISWEMNIEAGATAYYNFQYNFGQLGTTGNWAFEVFFNDDGTGNVTNSQGFDQPFTYPVGTTFKIAHIIDLEANLMEFWVDHTFQLSMPYDQSAVANGLAADIGAINFYAASNSSIFYWIDNICVRTQGTTPACGGDELIFTVNSYNGDEVCTDNGQVFANACDAGNNGLYALQEYGVCLSICDFNATFIGRSDGVDFTGQWNATDLLPAELYDNPCIVDAYDGDVPFPLYADTYLFDNEEGGDISVPLNTAPPGTNVFIYRCEGGLIDNLDCVSELSNAPGGPYYVVITGTQVDDYTFNLFPNSDCQVNPGFEFSCANPTFEGTIDSDFSQLSTLQETGGYANCYGGLRTYEGGEAFFRLNITEPTILDIDFGTAGGDAGLFLFNSNCGTGCVNYVEAPNGGG